MLVLIKIYASTLIYFFRLSKIPKITKKLNFYPRYDLKYGYNIGYKSILVPLILLFYKDKTISLPFILYVYFECNIAIRNNNTLQSLCIVVV